MELSEEILEHIEEHLGEYSDYSGISIKGEKLPVAAFSFDEPPLAIYVSYGLSNAKWRLGNGHICHFELVAGCLNDGSIDSESLKMLLLKEANDRLNMNEPIHQGDILKIDDYAVSLGGKFGSNFTHFTFCQPTFMDDDFFGFELEGGYAPVYFIWLVPIFEKEADYISEHGWDSFCKYFETSDYSLLELDRESYV